MDEKALLRAGHEFRDRGAFCLLRSTHRDINEETLMPTDGRQIENALKSIDETWSKVRPGKRILGSDRDGNSCVFICEDLSTPLGRFESNAEASAFAVAPATVEYLSSLVKKLIKERDEARAAIEEISQVAEPAYDAFNEQKPVDMATVLKTTHHWSHFILGR